MCKSNEPKMFVFSILISYLLNLVLIIDTEKEVRSQYTNRTAYYTKTTYTKQRLVAVSVFAYITKI